MKKRLLKGKQRANTSTQLAKVRPQSGAIQLSKKKASLFTTLVVATNFITYALFTPGMFVASPDVNHQSQTENRLYLMDKASRFSAAIR